MSYRMAFKVAWVLGALLMLASPALAGGAAVVELDALPAEVHAGETLHIGFTVLQHGVRPVHVWEGVGPVTPYLSATNRDTGETLRAEAVVDESIAGHFYVDVRFPSPGTWEWQIYPEPFGLINSFEPLKVQPAAAAAQPGTTLLAENARLGLQVAGAILLMAAAGLALAGRRSAPRIHEWARGHTNRTGP